MCLTYPKEEKEEQMLSFIVFLFLFAYGDAPPFPTSSSAFYRNHELVMHEIEYDITDMYAYWHLPSGLFENE